jgi:hypothetical protein
MAVLRIIQILIGFAMCVLGFVHGARMVNMFLFVTIHEVVHSFVVGRQVVHR